VLEIAHEMKYTPNVMARGLMLKKTDTLGVILPDLYGEFFSEVIHGIDEVARRKGYHIMVASSRSHKSEIESMLKVMRSGRVDGLIIMSPHIDSASLEKNLPFDMPVILLNCFCEDATKDAIVIDNFNGAYLMVKHLIKHGYQPIAIIKGVEKNYDAEERLRGYRAALTEAGLEVSPKLELHGNFSEESGYTAMKKILGMKPRPTAVFAANDAMAIGAISAVHEARLAIPADIAVTGFDDIPMAKYMKPSLSSVHVPIYDLGALAAQKLIESIETETDKPKEKTALSTSLMVRESCGCV
jgi:LacI family transcriptional regulator